MKIFHYKLLISIFASILFIETTNAKLLNFDTEIKNCLKNADNPDQNTGGPKYDDLDVIKALEICNIAFKKHPNSKQVIRSLARVYYKKNNYKQAFKLAIRSSELGDPYSDWLVGIMYKEGAGIQKNDEKYPVEKSKGKSEKYNKL